MKKLEDLEVGDCVRWGSVDWLITDRDLYRESADYYELHWKLEPEQGQERYLVMSREQKVSGTEEMWVCTRQVNIIDVKYKTDSGEWKAFKETDSINSPPKNLHFENMDFSLQGETEGEAEDDDGNTVTKLTWDYYNVTQAPPPKDIPVGNHPMVPPTRSCNLAIEIWKEPDADYFEAYDGRVTCPADFEFLPPRQFPQGKQITKALSNIFIIVVVLIIFLPAFSQILGTFNIDGEYAVSALILVSMIIFSVYISSSPGLLVTSLLAAIAASIFLIKLRGLGYSYWEYSVYGVSAGFILTWLFSKFYNSAGHFNRVLAASNCTLVFLWIISFAHYIKFAPRPHNFGSLLVACILPLAPAVAVFLIYKLTPQNTSEV